MDIKAMLDGKQDCACGYLTAIGLDFNTFRSFYREALLCDAIRYAKDLKDRYTVLWIAYALGVDSEGKIGYAR